MTIVLEIEVNCIRKSFVSNFLLDFELILLKKYYCTTYIDIVERKQIKARYGINDTSNVVGVWYEVVELEW